MLFSWVSVQRLLLPSLQEAHTLFWYLLQAVQMDTSSVSEHETQSAEAVSLLESSALSCTMSESQDAWSPVLHELSPADFIIRVSNGPGWIGSWLSGSCTLCWELGLALGVGSGMLLSPWAELWSLHAPTSWELTWVLLVWWKSSELLEEWSHFFLCGGGQALRKWMPHWGSTQQGEIRQERYGRRRSFRMVSCWEAPEWLTSQVLVWQGWLGCFCPVTWWSPMPHLYTEKKPLKKCTRAVALLIPSGWPWQKPPGRLYDLPGPSLPTSIHVSSPFWSGNHHTSKLAFVPAHPVCILVELLPDYSLAIVEGLGCSLIPHRPISPQSEHLLL